MIASWEVTTAYKSHVIFLKSSRRDRMVALFFVFALRKIVYARAIVDDTPNDGPQRRAEAGPAKTVPPVFLNRGFRICRELMNAARRILPARP
jgi:hypothetical protein